MPLPLRERCELALHVAHGMAYLHAANIVHFDIKPDNLLVERLPGGRYALKVADFGLSKLKVRHFVSTVTDLRGTLPYMAPELVASPEKVRRTPGGTRCQQHAALPAWFLPSWPRCCSSGFPAWIDACTCIASE